MQFSSFWEMSYLFLKRTTTNWEVVACLINKASQVNWMKEQRAKLVIGYMISHPSAFILVALKALSMSQCCNIRLFQVSTFQLKLNKIMKFIKKKSRIGETDADSITDTIVGWTKNTPKPNFVEKRKKIIQTFRNMPNLAICPSTRGL